MWDLNDMRDHLVECESYAPQDFLGLGQRFNDTRAVIRPGEAHE